jgi:hypothetical protein
VEIRSAPDFRFKLSGAYATVKNRNCDPKASIRNRLGRRPTRLIFTACDAADAPVLPKHCLCNRAILRTAGFARQ